MKAITPVIALVMLMLITVGSVGMAYTWFSNMMTAQTEETIAIPVGGVQCINNRISVIVTNTGANSNITDSDIVVAEINGTSVRNTPFFGGFNTNGLVGYWRFEGDAKDYSTYGNDGTVYGANAAPGKFGNALSFDGVNDYVTTSALPESQNSITITMWVKPASADSYRCMYTQSNKQWVLATNSGGNLYAFNDYWGAVSTSSIAPIATWTYIAAVTYTSGANSIVRLYKNGVLVNGDGITSSSYPLIPSSAVGISCYTAPYNYFNGAIDEVGVWNRVLGADEITQLNNTNAGNFTLAPQKAMTLINSYPVFSKGKYNVRVGTRNGVIERTAECT